MLGGIERHPINEQTARSVAVMLRSIPGALSTTAQTAGSPPGTWAAGFVFWRLSISSRAVDRSHVTRNRFLQDLFGVLGDHAIKIMAVDYVELERCQRFADMLYLARRQRDEVRIAAHEGEPLSVGGDSQDVACTNDASPAGPTGPMHYGAPREMSATANQRHAIPYLERVTIP